MNLISFIWINGIEFIAKDNGGSVEIIEPSSFTGQKVSWFIVRSCKHTYLNSVIE